MVCFNTLYLFRRGIKIFGIYKMIVVIVDYCRILTVRKSQRHGCRYHTLTLELNENLFQFSILQSVIP